MSYFLWSSMPDDELWRVTVDGSLRSPEVLEKQVRRMLHDPKVAGAGRQLRRPVAPASQPEDGQSRPGHVPSFDEALREAMIRETELFFAAVMRGDLSLLRLPRCRLHLSQ